jgi:hypothetical protein
VETASTIAKNGDHLFAARFGLRFSYIYLFQNLFDMQAAVPMEYAAVTLLMFFGLKSIKDTAKNVENNSNELDEFAEAEKLVKEKVICFSQITWWQQYSFGLQHLLQYSEVHFCSKRLRLKDILSSSILVFIHFNCSFGSGWLHWWSSIHCLCCCHVFWSLLMETETSDGRACFAHSI